MPGCEGVLLALVDQIEGDVDTPGLEAWFRTTWPDAQEDTSDPEVARFVFDGCAAHFTKRMPLTHGVHLTLDPPAAVPLLLDRTDCTTAPVKEAFEHDGRGPLGHWYTECVRPEVRVQLNLHGEPEVTRGDLDQRELPARKVWLKRPRR